MDRLRFHVRWRRGRTGTFKKCLARGSTVSLSLVALLLVVLAHGFGGPPPPPVDSLTLLKAESERFTPHGGTFSLHLIPLRESGRSAVPGLQPRNVRIDSIRFTPPGPSGDRPARAVLREFRVVPPGKQGRGHEMVFLLDSSQSMEEESQLLKASARQFLDQIDTPARVAVIDFHHTDSVKRPFLDPSVPPQLERLHGFVDRTPARGLTPLYHTMCTALGHYGSETGRKRVLFVLTDGNNKVRPDRKQLCTDAGDVIERARSRWVRIVMVGLGEKVDRAQLGRLARATGGTALSIENPDDLGLYLPRMAQATTRGTVFVRVHARSLSGPLPEHTLLTGRVALITRGDSATTSFELRPQFASGGHP